MVKNNTFIEFSPVKLNLYLEVLSKRQDGYHNIESFMTFCSFGDILTVKKSDSFKFKTTGMFANDLILEDNIIIKTIKSLEEIYKKNFKVNIILEKRLPISSGMAGGSSNAAAIVRIIHKIYNLDEKNNLIPFLTSIGADVPFCYYGKSAIVTGIGENLNFKKHNLENFFVLLINPLQQLSTKNIFEKIDLQKKSTLSNNFASLKINIESLKNKSNHLEKIAKKELPVISNILEFLKLQTQSLFVRMTGSGATCFSIYQNSEDLKNAEILAKSTFPKYWIKSTKLVNSINDINLV